MKRHPKGKGCWYMITTTYCPICLSERTERERRYDKRPLHTHDWVQVYDWCEL